MHVMIFIDPVRIREDGPTHRELLTRLERDWGIRSSLVLPERLSEDLQPVHEHRLGAGNVLVMPPSGPIWVRQHAAQSLASQVHRDPANLVLCIGTGSLPEAEATARHLDCPVVISTWSSEETRVASTRMQHVGAWVAPTRRLADRMTSRVGTELVQCIPPGIAPRTEPAPEIGLAPTLAILACDGSPEIVRAALAGLEQAIAVVPDLQICMEIDAENGHQAWREADARGLLDHVSTIADATQVRSLMTSCDIILNPNRGPRVRTMVLEAMAASRAIISAPAEDLDWLIDGTTAAIVDGATPENWSGTLLNLLTQPGNRRALGIGASDWVTEHHDPARHAAEWAKLLSGVSKGVSYPFSSESTPRQP